MSALSRRKGRVFQAEIAKRWRDSGLFPNAASTQGAQVRYGRNLGPTPPDVEGTPFWVECKHVARPQPVEALRQALRERDANKSDRIPIAVVKPSGERELGTVVCIRLSDFEAIVQQAQGKL